ncbi:MAG: hypothetical protein ACRD3T_19815 [Terriglobia bacterium]
MPETRRSKKQSILDAVESLGIAKAGEGQIRRIQAHLVRQLGIAGKPSASHIIKTLRDAGIPVGVQTPFDEPSIEEPYATRLKGLLQFQGLQAAEDSLRTIHAAFEEYREAADRRGMRLVRGLVLKGKQRAAAIARNPRVDPANRAAKREIVNWFRVWLESPDLFFVWLEVRKKSTEFQALFGDAAREKVDSDSSKTNG